MQVNLERSTEYPEGEILIDPTPHQKSDALAKGLNPDAGKALLSLAAQGRLSSTEQELIDRAWQQLGEDTELPVKDCVEFDSTKLPSQVGIIDVITFRDRI